jgi:hypothetical protein
LGEDALAATTTDGEVVDESQGLASMMRVSSKGLAPLIPAAKETQKVAATLRNISGGVSFFLSRRKIEHRPLELTSQLTLKLRHEFQPKRFAFYRSLPQCNPISSAHCRRR